MKLTKAQWEYLGILRQEDKPRVVMHSYLRAKKLVQLGLAERKPRRGIMVSGYHISITPAGLAALAEKDPSHE